MNRADPADCERRARVRSELQKEDMNRMISRSKRIASFVLCVLFLSGWMQLGAAAVDTAASVTPDLGFGYQFAVALHSNGSVYAWGNNSNGQLATGNATQSNTPVAVSLPENTTCTAIAVGYDHVLALLSDGFLYAWGANGYGQLGLGDSVTSDKNTPQKVTALQGKTIVAIAAGQYTSYALTQDGSVYAWGDNQKCQLGVSSESEFSRWTPAEISALSDVFVAKLYAGSGTAAVVDSTGSVWVFGDNSKSQLGVENASTVLPVKLTGKTNLPAVVSDVAFGSQTMSLLGSGVVSSAGINSNGQFGNGATSSTQAFGLKLATLSESITDVESSALQTVFLSVSGAVYRCGQVVAGDGSQQNLTTPVLLSCGDKTISRLGAGYGNAGAIAQDGSIWVWGDNTAGQLCSGSTDTASADPVQVKGVGGEGTLSLGSSARVHRVSLRAVASVPTPTYSVTVPTGIDAGSLYQAAAGAADAISDTAFAVTAEDVDNLFGEKKLVIRMRGAGGSFSMTDEAGNALSYQVCTGRQGNNTIASNGILGELTSDGSCYGRIRIDRSQITTSGKYEGQVFFDITVEDIDAGGDGT